MNEVFTIDIISTFLNVFCSCDFLFVFQTVAHEWSFDKIRYTHCIIPEAYQSYNGPNFLLMKKMLMIPALFISLLIFL